MITNRKYFTKTIIASDMIGPIIDISKMPLLRGLDCRFDTEQQIADKLNRENPGTALPEEDGWTDRKVLIYVESELKRPSGLNYVEKGIIDGLLHAVRAGIEVHIASTVPKKEVFDAGWNAIKYFVSTYYNTSDKTLLDKAQPEWLQKERFDADLPLGTSDEVWNSYLSRHSKEHSVIVVNDSPMSMYPSISEDMVHEWIPGVIDANIFGNRISEVVDGHARNIEAHKSLTCHDKIAIKDTVVVGGFCLLNEENRNKVSKKWLSLRELRINSTKSGNSDPICVFLGGPPGSGKSFFVKQCAADLGIKNSEYAETSMSGVIDRSYARAVESHIEDASTFAAVRSGRELDAETSSPLDVTKSKLNVALLDEVDTVIGQYTVFRHLMDPMTGTLTDDIGKKKRDGQIAPNLIWFFAGSAGRTREDFILKMVDKDEKVRDFFDRIQFHFELPGASHPEESVLQAIIKLRQQPFGTDLIEFEKNALLAFAATKWRSARHLDSTCRLIGLGLEDGATRLKHSHLKIDDYDDLFSATVDLCSDVFDDNPILQFIP